MWTCCVQTVSWSFRSFQGTCRVRLINLGTTSSLTCNLAAAMRDWISCFSLLSSWLVMITAEGSIIQTFQCHNSARFSSPRYNILCSWVCFVFSKIMLINLSFHALPLLVGSVELWKMKPLRKCQNLNLLEWPPETGSQSEKITIDCQRYSRNK